MAGDSRKHSIAFILITIFVDTLGFGICIPVFPKLIMELTGTDLSQAAVYSGWLVFIYALMQFICAPILGNLSDAVGRRPVLIVSLLAFCVNFFVMALAPAYWWLVITRFFAGGFGATYAVANAYIVDTTELDDRAQRFGLVGAVWGVGFIMGPMIGGLLADFGLRAPFFVAAALAAANALYGFIVFPETLAKENRRAFTFARANPVGAVVQMAQYGGMLALFAVVFLFQIAHDAYPAIWSFYTMHKLDWAEADVGYSLGYVGITAVVVQAGIVGPFVKRFGARVSVCVGLIGFSIGFLCTAFATATWHIYAACTVGALMGLTMPAMQTLLTAKVPVNEQGALQGAMSSLVGLAAILSPLMMTYMFAAFSAADARIYFPGAPFAVSAVICTGSIALFWWVTSGDGNPNVKEQVADEN